MTETSTPAKPPQIPVDTEAQSDPSPSGVGTSNSWPARCSLAELARILTLMYGPQAPTESSLKKWSVIGVFDSCLAPEPLTEQQTLPSFTREALMRPRRVGRPGLCLDTEKALGKVYEQWPHLADSTPNAVFQLAVAQVSDRLQEAMLRTLPSPAAPQPADAAPAPASSAPTTPSAPIAVGAPLAGGGESQMDRIERLVNSLAEEMVAIRREMAQISSPRNNLLTKLDDAVMRAQQVLSSGTRGAGGSDPLVEAKRDRDMGVLKSMLSDILSRLPGA